MVLFRFTMQNEGALHGASEGHVHASAKRRKRFGPNEDYLLAVQVNKDTPFAAKYGGIRKAWQSLADKLNASPNFRMEMTKGTTAQARFEALMIKHRSFEAKSARDSDTDESETRLVQVLTDVGAKVNNHNTAKACEPVIFKGVSIWGARIKPNFRDKWSLHVRLRIAAQL
ncbi:unnamed protein product [Phytophthora fragariaefolia]|uniref:Unnamed protein product n=1 Tax=Phytophthora fragariaefolia TaxID=1490495 RepID=A0A9W7CV53_9STRA|nr:unnamed protein product [Phytophthora fragariaefolia]